MKRVYLSLLAVAMISILVSAASFALFTASTDNKDNVFTAGTVTLNQPVDALVNIQNIAPGDSGNAGTLTITYTGNLDAWVFIKTNLTGILAGGSYPLAVTIADNHGGSYAVPANDGKFLLNDSDGTRVFELNDSIVLTVSYAFPLAAGNEYRGAEATLLVSVHAVQAKNNTNSAGTGPIWENEGASVPF